MNRKLLAPVLLLLLALPASASHPLECVGAVQVGTNGGSGTIIARNDSHCLVLTCQHVATKRGYEAFVSFPGYNIVQGVVVKASQPQDLALILVDNPGEIEPAQLGATDKANGPFYLMGYPQHDRQYINWQKGNADVLQKEILIVDCAPIPGMSGGPTFDSRGYLVGVVVGYSLDPDFGVCIPSGELFPFLLEFVEETKMSKLVPAALLAAAIANAPAEIIPFEDQTPVESANWEQGKQDAAKCGLLDRLRPNSRRTWQRRHRTYRQQYQPRPRTQRVEPQTQNCPNGQCPRPDNSCPNGQCPRPDNSCPNGQCPRPAEESPRTQRLNQGFRFQRRTPRREIEIDVAPEPADPQTNTFELEIQVQDMFPEEHSIVVDEPKSEGKSTEYASVAAIVGAIVAAYRSYVA